ncbi:MAG TPA: PilZ domain-containing protein [Candidatus Desulfaltia sp.]|nr:PilZ domain-containing protein [Candidatus Desulfaltia sp.]
MAERRKDRRIKEENRVVIESSPAGAQGESFTANAFTRDLSLTGARILTDRLYPLNSKLKLTLYLSRSRQIIRICSTVRWMKGSAEGLYEMGVQFQPGIPDAVMALINHVYSKDQRIPTAIDAARTA